MPGFHNAFSKSAFFFDNATCKLTALVGGPLGRQNSSVASGVNDSGLVIGTFTSNTGVDRAFSAFQGTISNKGHLVGFASVAGTSLGSTAVAHVGGQDKPFPLVLVIPPVNRATGVNESGEVVGFLDALGTVRGMKFFPNLNRWFQIRPAEADPNVRGLETTHAFLSRNHFEPTQVLGTLEPANPQAFSRGLSINN